MQNNDRNDFIFDLETYPNLFTCTVMCAKTRRVWQFELSERRNQLDKLFQLMRYIKLTCKGRLVGFNNEAFDYPILHLILTEIETVTVSDIYAKVEEIINGERFASIIWESDRIIDQVDLFKIHHFDNMAKSTSLKALQFAMRSESIEDLPFAPGTIIPVTEIDTVLKYNLHDVLETHKFYEFSLPAIAFREELTERNSRDCMNFNDTKIGKEYLIAELEKAGIECYDRSSGRRMPRQTIRHQIRLADIILPYIGFARPEFQRIHEWLTAQVITETKGIFNDLAVTVDGFEFSFGLGGIHGSMNNTIVESDEFGEVIDIDVVSYYPSLAIVNALYPAHLGPGFCFIYAKLKAERVNHPKGTAINAMLKLALNGTFGDSNNPYSALRDSQFTMAITVNGQLIICMLAEWLLEISGLKLIQANTDGITVYCPRTETARMRAICKEWSELTRLELEESIYSRMMIRDVNNYLAETNKGKIKRKGAYCHETPLENPFTQELQWHQDHGARIVAKAAEAALMKGEDIRQFILKHQQISDFMLRAKINRSTQLFIGDIEQPQRITRYYISRTGQPMFKVMPPVAGKEFHTLHVYRKPDGTTIEARTKSEIDKAAKRGEYLHQYQTKAPDRKTDINKGWLAREANRLSTVNRNDIDFEWYIAEAIKLVEPLKRRINE